jgi:O-antigen/teichoic acid export membrane protein
VDRRLRAGADGGIARGGGEAGPAARERSIAAGRLDEQAVRSVPWTLLSYVGNRGVGLLAQIALARLLAPSDFGLIALANTTTLVLNYLRDLGLANTIILRHDLSRRAQGTVLTLALGMSLALGAVGFLLAAPIADLFGEHELTGVVRALSLTVCLGGFQGFAEAQLQKHMLFRERFVAQFAQAMVYAAVAVSLAAATDLGVWALVIGQMAMIVTGAAVVGVYAAPYWVRPAWDWGEARDVLRTSRGFLAQVLLYFLQQNTDYIVIGRLLNAAQVGYYYTSYRLAEIPFSAISDPVSRVTFAAFSGMRARGEDIRDAYLSVLRLVAVVSAPLGIALSTAADPFTRAVMGEKWVPMIGTLSILGLWAALRPLQNTAAWLLNSSGAPGTLAKINAALYVPFAGAIVAMALGPGIEGVAWVVVGFTLLSIAAIWIACRALVGVAVSDQARAVRPAVLSCVPAWIAGYATATLLDQEPVIGLIATAIACSATYLAALSLIDVELVRRSLAQIRRTLGR